MSRYFLKIRLGSATGVPYVFPGPLRCMSLSLLLPSSRFIFFFDTQARMAFFRLCECCKCSIPNTYSDFF